MLGSLFRAVRRVPTCGRRLCSCWCPEQPLDPDTLVTYLPNGVRVMTEENCSPLACVSLFVIAGPRFETANSNGLTHFIEHLAYKGFKSMLKTCFEEKINKMGARLLAKTRRDMQIFSILLPSQLAPEAVLLLSKIVLELALDERELNKEREIIRLEAIDVDNDPVATLFHYLHATAFQGTPLGQSVIGPQRNIAKFDKCTATTFLAENYTTCRLVVGASGRVCHEHILGAAGGTFGSLCPCGEWDPDIGPARFTASEVVYRDDTMPYCHVAIGLEVPGYTSKHYYTLLVMKHLIGSWNKSQGRLDNQPFYSARGAGTGQCESYQSFYIPYKDIGLWGVYFVVDKHHIDDMLFIIQDAWMQMSIMCHNFELEKAKNLARVELSKVHYGVVNSCQDMGVQMMYACRRHSLEMKLHDLDIVQPFAIKDVCMTWLYNRSPAVAAVGPSECLPEYNRTASGMYWLRY